MILSIVLQFRRFKTGMVFGEWGDGIRDPIDSLRLVTYDYILKLFSDFSMECGERVAFFTTSLYNI